MKSYTQLLSWSPWQRGNSENQGWEELLALPDSEALRLSPLTLQSSVLQNLKPCNDNYLTPTMCKGTLLSVLYKLIESSQQLWVVGIIKLILQGKLKHRDVRELIHPARECWSWAINPGSLAPAALTLSLPPHTGSGGGVLLRPLLLSCTSVQWYLGLMGCDQGAGSALGKC